MTVIGTVTRSVVPDVAARVFACVGINFGDPAALYTWPWELEAVRQAAVAQGMSYKTLAPELSTWARVSNALEHGLCSVVYVTAHGDYRPILGEWRTIFTLNDTVVLSRPVPGFPFWPDVHSLGLTDSGRIKFFWLNSCNSGVNSDMAFELGMMSANNYEYMDQTYLGWDCAVSGDERLLDFVQTYWSWFGTGYPVSTSLWWAGFQVGWDMYSHVRPFGFPETTWME